MNACVTLLFLWPLSFDEARVDVRLLPDYKTWIIHLQDGTPDQQRKAAGALGVYFRDALPALAALRYALQKTEHPKVAEAIAGTLGDIGSAAQEAVPDLCAAVKRQVLDPTNALHAALAMEALPEPLARYALTTNPTQKQAEWAVNVLEAKARQRPAFVLERLLEYLPQWDEEVTRFALVSLQQVFDELLGDELKHGKATTEIRLAWVTPALLKKAEQTLAPWLTDPKGKHFDNAAALLMLLHPPRARDLFPKLFPGYASKRWLWSLQALTTVQLLYVYPYLLDQLAPSEAMRHWAEGFLRVFVSNADWGCARVCYARRCVLTGLQHASPIVREVVLGLLEEYIVDDDRIRMAFVAMLHDPDPQVRFTAALWLERARHPTSVEAVPVLQELACSRDPEMRVKAIDLLALHGRHARRAVPTLLRLTKHSHTPTRMHAVVALATIDPSAHATYLPHAKTLLAGDDLQMVHETVLALARLGPPAKALLPELRTTLQNHKGRYTQTLVRIAIAVLDPKETDAALAALTNDLQTSGDANVLFDVSALLRLTSFPTIQLLPTMLPLLTKHLENGQSQVAAPLAGLCLQLDPKCKDALVAFHAGLARGDWAWYTQAALLQTHAKPVLPLILDVYKNPKTEANTRLRLLHLLNQLGPHAASIAPELAEHANGPLAPFVRHTVRVLTREGRP